MTVDKATPRKRIKLSEGDVFEFAVPDGRFGYGIILKRGGLPNGGTPYIAIFRDVFDGRPDLDQFARQDVALAGWSMDALFHHGRWKIIARNAPLPEVPFPNFKVAREGKIYVTDVDGQELGEATGTEANLLDYRFSRAPIGFQSAFEAIHGFKVWEEHYEKLTPAHAHVRITRAAI